MENQVERMPRPLFEDALERTLEDLKQSLEDLPFVVADENVRQRLELPKNLGWVEFRPLSGTELDEFEERRVRSRWRQREANDVEMEIIADWASAFRYLFNRTITDFEIRLSEDKVVRKSDFRRQEDATNFLCKLHWKLQRFIGLSILKASGWEPPRQF